MVAVQLAPSGLLLTSVCFAFCIFIQVAQPQQLICANDLTNEGSCYSERQVICNNYTDNNRDCLSQTVRRLSYGGLEYTVLYGNSLAYSESSFEVVALKLCHKEALELTLSDVACAKQCTSRKYEYIADSFIFSCDNLSNLIYHGLTIVVFRTIENQSCSDLKTKFVVIDTRDVNECQDGTYNCSENALCNDKKCGYSCICQLGYQMEDDNYTCASVDCGAPPPVLHGNTTTSGSVLQSVATYTCDNGYNLDGDQTLTCESNAMWSGDEPECRAVDCGNLSTIDNGMVNAVTTTFTSVANYTCDNGYDLIGPSTRVCQANRSWSEMEPFCEVVDCGSVVSPSHGDVRVQETTFQSVVTYSCISGYSLVGDDNRTCQANGNWSEETPQCNPVDCGALPPVIHGNTTTSGTIFQSVATYFCDNGYNLVGNQTRICESNATWSGDKPECKAVDCGDPGTPINGEVDVPATTFQSEAYYACNPGYVIVGMNRRLCKANGSWSGHLPSCQIVDCGALDPPLNGTVSVDETVYESIAMYTCDDGYILMGERHRLCLANGSWSNEEPMCKPVDCGPPPAPTNGSVLHKQTVFQSIADYSCHVGYRLVGRRKRTCEAQGVWSGETPTCNVVDCGPLTAPEYGAVDVTMTTYRGVALYNCRYGYDLVGVMSRDCQANATWSDKKPVCKAVDCGPLSAPQHAIINVTTTTFPSMAVYYCNNGYDLNGPSTRMCQADRSWSRLEPSCTPVDCGPPPSLENGLIAVTFTSFQSVVKYTCDDGYNLEGVANRTCKADRTWSGNQPVCVAIDCGQPSSPDNGFVDANETFFGSKAIYLCGNGYVLDGQRARECLANGSWSNEVPECQPIDCGTLEDPIGGNVFSVSTTLLSMATYTCISGYMLSGNKTRQCQPDGSWSGDMPQCIPVDCGLLEDPEDGEVVATMTTFRSITVYVCNKGYFLNGSASRTCRADSQWSGTKPSCTDICTTEEHGCDLNVSDCRSGHESVAQRCKCKEGFETKNEVCVKACQKDGNWSQTATGCMASISCPQDYQGNITRLCGEEGIWQNADNSSCKNIAFINFRNEVAELFGSEVNDDSVGAVLFLVERLDRNIGVVNLTSDDLKLAVDILNKTVDFLTQHLETGGSDFSNQSVAVVNTMDQLLDVDMLSFYEQSNDSLGVTLLQSSEGYINYLASAIRDSGTAKMSINMNNIELEALVLNTEDEVVADIYYPEEEPIPPGCHHLVGHQPTYTPRVKIPYQLVKERGRKLNSTQVPAGNAIIKNIEQLLPLNRGLQRPVTSVISTQVSGDVLNQSAVLQDEPVSINFTIKDLFIVVNETAKCVFWKFSNNGNDKEGQWSSEGVTTKVLDNGVVQCNSTHLTSFTVIVAINDFEIHPAYEYLTYIGVGVSLVCLFMTIIFFLSERKTLFSRVHYFVHLNLAIALFSAYLIFAVGTHFGAHKIVPCTIVAALLHFLFLAAFCWMLCEGVMLYLMLVVVFSSLSKKWWFFLILGWGPPVIFVAAGYTYGAFRGGYVDINTCWLANGGTRWFFIGPMIAIIVINVVFLVIVIGSLCKNGSKDARKQMDDKGKNVQLVVSLVKASIILLPLLGTTWIFGLFALDEASSYVFGSLFIICSSLQGLFIFIFHVLRSERVWGRIKKKYGLFGSTQSHSVTQQSMFKSSRNASVILDKKDNGLKNLESKPQHADTSGPVVLEEDGEFDDGNDNCTCEPVNLEMNGQDSESSVNIDNKHGSSLSIDAKDNSHY